MPNFKEQIKPFITRQNAQEWSNDPEQWLYVTNLLVDADIEYNPHGDDVDRMVDYIENEFEQILKNA